MGTIDRVKEMMSDQKVDQSGLGSLAGASRSVVNQWLSGKIQKIGPKYAANLRKNCGYNPEWVTLGFLPKLLPSLDTPVAHKNKPEPVSPQESGVVSRDIRVEAISDRLNAIAEKLTADDWIALDRVMSGLEAIARRNGTK